MYEIRLRDQEILNLLPFIWTTNIFFKSFANAVGVRYQKENLDSEIDIILQYYMVGKYLTKILIFIFFIEWVNKEARNLLLKLRKSINKMPVSDPDIEVLLTEIESNIDFVATGWSLFTLNKGFILSFLSALISFSVLFVQLAEQRA